MKRLLALVVLGLGAGVGIGFGCAAGSGSNTGGSGGSGANGTTGTTPSSGTFGNTTGTVGPDASCAKFTAAAKRDPAAVLIVLDKSASMNTSGKWAAAQLAIVSAIDQAAFDNTSLGLVAFPSTSSPTPQCLCDACCGGDLGVCGLVYPTVSCGVTPLPQIAIADSGTDKSNAPSGVRKEMYSYLATSAPLSNSDDGSPVYDAMVAGYNALKAYPNVKKRFLIVVTDGGFSCTSVAVPPRLGYTDTACLDWEIPDTVNALITAQRTDPTTPVNTFMVGLPGSNTHGETQALAPYAMRLALSTYAVSGSPDTVDPTCDKSAVFTKPGADPAKPCHIDLSTGPFDANVLATALNSIRGKTLDCVFTLPDPPPGQTIDMGQVNVETTQMGMGSTLPKRSSPSDMCTTDGCWDYNSMGQVELIGKACDDVKSSTTTKVDITVGCTTIVK